LAACHRWPILPRHAIEFFYYRLFFSASHGPAARRGLLRQVVTLCGADTGKVK
jgi:hypothetical protein